MRCILTAAAQEFITPLSAGALAGERVFTDLFDAATEFDVGHIRLAREADLVVVAPATADLMAKMAGGHADDLASAVLLATDQPVLIAPAMNPHMWEHAGDAAQSGAACRRRRRGGRPERRRDGGSAARPASAAWPSRWRSSAAAEPLLGSPAAARPLAGRRVLVTSGPDPRADRSGALHRQPLVRQAGPRHRRGCRGRRRRGDAGLRPGATCPIRPACERSRSRPRGRCWRR